MIKLVGIPYDENSSFLRGCASAPSQFRSPEIERTSNAFSEFGKEIKKGMIYEDIGDIIFPNIKPEYAYHTIKSFIGQIVNLGDQLICIGGDHSVSFPVIEAYAERYDALNVLHLDAHPDLYDHYDDNPYSHASPFARILEKQFIRSLTQVGIRTLNTHQREQAVKFGVKIVEMKDFNSDFIQNLRAPLYISIDMDVLDPAFAPGVSHYEPGGMTVRELIKIIQSIPVPIVGADIVEYNPKRDINHMTAMVVYKLFKELVYQMIV